MRMSDLLPPLSSDPLSYDNFLSSSFNLLITYEYSSSVFNFRFDESKLCAFVGLRLSLIARVSSATAKGRNPLPLRLEIAGIKLSDEVEEGTRPRDGCRVTQRVKKPQQQFNQQRSRGGHPTSESKEDTRAEHRW